MLTVKMSQLSAKRLDIVSKTNIKMCLFVTILIRVDFSAIKVSVFLIEIDVVST